jgi:large subunit ribosomal protein L10
MSRQLKDLILTEMTSRFKTAENFIFVGYRGLSNGQLADFRSQVTKSGGQLAVVRNRITIRAFSELGKPEEVKDLFDGPTAIIDGEDPVAMAKAAVEFAKRDKKLEVKGGLVEGGVLNAEEVVGLSKMPSRLEMIGILVGSAIGVGGRVAGALLGPGGRIAGGLKAMAEKDGEDASGSPEPQAA